MIKLIASDLDGTLLQNGAQEMPPAIFDIIRSLKEKGIIFVAASGRQYTNIQRLFAPVKNDIAYICENGALCIYQDKVILQNTIDKEIGHALFHSIKNQPDCEILLTSKNYSYLETTSERYACHMKNIVKNDVLIVDDILTVNDDYLKISACNFNGIKDHIPYFKEKYGSRLTIAAASDIWLDMVSLGTNKGSALKKLLEVLSIIPEECMAFGDHYNDVEMLEYIPQSYAMANAQPGIADKSRYVTSSVLDILQEVLH